MIRILLTHRVRLTMELVGAALEGEPDLTVAGMVTSVDDALSFLEDDECDLVLVGESLPNNGAIKLVSAIRQSNRDLQVLIMGLPENPALILPYIEAGASGFILRSESVPDLLQKVRASAENKALVSPEMAALLIDKVADLSQKLAALSIDTSDYQELTEREKEVLDLVAAGRTNQDIADALVIEVGTVKNHVHNILNKLNVHSRQDAALYLSIIENRNSPESNSDDGESYLAARI